MAEKKLDAKKEVIREDVYEPPVVETRILKGYTQIGRALGAGAVKAKQWKAEGAPITVGEDNIPRAEKNQLWNWYQNQNINDK